MLRPWAQLLSLILRRDYFSQPSVTSLPNGFSHFVPSGNLEVIVGTSTNNGLQEDSCSRRPFVGMQLVGRWTCIFWKSRGYSKYHFEHINPAVCNNSPRGIRVTTSASDATAQSLTSFLEYICSGGLLNRRRQVYKNSYLRRCAGRGPSALWWSKLCKSHVASPNYF
ncbi:hypothetical protein BDN72DRAFT_638378 [Pluteus cervinus]|uniref:Uncharacterized protein n=1 Tax=Pluteus cervinus TaxID=181527 RepID=A0ACD3AVR2_9AGAR|nr:hypothetical protein BDN72DRAFT_638378 [Pluteus cervinus]